jgi:hypothetical protein
LAHVSREFESNASRLSRSTRLMRPAKASTQRTGYSNLDLGHLECDMARVADDLRADPKRRWGMAARSEREWERLFGAESCRCAATVGLQGFPTFAGDLLCPLCVVRANGPNRPFPARQDRVYERARSARKRTSAEGVGCANSGPSFERQRDHSVDQVWYWSPTARHRCLCRESP